MIGHHPAAKRLPFRPDPRHTIHLVGLSFDRGTGPARPAGRRVAVAAALAAIALAGAGCRKRSVATHAEPAVVPPSPAAGAPRTPPPAAPRRPAHARAPPAPQLPG